MRGDSFSPGEPEAGALIPHTPGKGKTTPSAFDLDLQHLKVSLQAMSEGGGHWGAGEPGPAPVTPPSGSQDDGSDAPPPPPAPPRRGPRRIAGVKPGWFILGLLAAVGLLYLSWAAFPIRVVEVTGNTHLSSAEVRRLAGLPERERPSSSSFGWLYYGAWRAQGLAQSPWLLSAQITRKFPNTVQIAVTERQPAARWQRAGQPEVVVSADGTVLKSEPGVNLGNVSVLPVINGWGPERVTEALQVARVLSRYTVQSVTYTPAGLSAKTANGTVWGGDLNTFVKYAGSVGMYPNKKIHIYPWGVSVQE